jgi:hypothetical protein
MGGGKDGCDGSPHDHGHEHGHEHGHGHGDHKKGKWVNVINPRLLRFVT